MIRTATDGAIRVVTFDRPKRRNALRPQDLDALEKAVVEADESVIYLHGAGSAFCAGADLDVVASLDDPEAFAKHGQRVARAIETADAVVVAGIDGAARGGGVELALACDLRIATPEATFGETGVQFGMFGAWGGTVRLPRILGEGDALDFALSGRVIDAEDAHRMGLVSRIVPDPRTVAHELAANPTDALETIKYRIRDRTDQETKERAEAEAFASLHHIHGDSLAARQERE